ncbi:hypothetical protein CASFOL_022461 [Castilleja foliolosa]|uniref:Uncharacterized protein n=1 Tax=Castilleja foliolosa TaxID=1961234 RepID=A0ABD3CX61_9LAMI
MDGYLDNQLMLLGWLSHGMAMPVAYADGPFIISEITNILVFGWTIVSSSFQDFAYWDGVKKVYMDGYLDNQLMLLGWLSQGMAMPVADVDGPFIISKTANKLVFWWTIASSCFQDFAYCCSRELIFSNPAQKLFLLCLFIDRYLQIILEGDGPVPDADGPFIISEITNKLVFGWTIVSSSFQDFAYCCTRELIFSNPAQKIFLLCRFIDRYVQIIGEGDRVKKVYMHGYLDNQLMLLGWLSHEMTMPDFAFGGTRELIFSNPAQKLFLLCHFIDRYVQIVGEGDGVKKVYMDDYLDNQLMLLGLLSHGMAMPVADVDGPFIISEIINKLVFGWTIVSSSFQDFAYSVTRELIFSNPAQKLFLLCRFIDRYVQIVGERDGVKKVYMDGYLDNQLMLLGWLSHGMAMPVAYADAPFIIS